MNKQGLANELHKPIIRKFEKRKAQSSFKRNIWGAALADMQLIYKFLLYAIDIYISYTWVAPLNEKMALPLLMLFRKFQMNQNANQTKYGQIKGVNFTID